MCCNYNLGLVIEAKAFKGAGQKWSMGFTFHALENVGKCEGMNPHTPKWAPTLGIGVLNFQKEISDIKTHWIEAFLIPLKSSWNLDV
jgi:hypothetical protein